MTHRYRQSALPWLLALAQCLLLPAVHAQGNDGASADVEEIVVTARRRPSDAQSVGRSLSVLDLERLGGLPGQTHVQEALVRVPGVNLQRGNGQEYLPALRSPVLTGAGACGALLTAEDGIPLTSPGFCNINELFFAHHEAASRIEVLRGPGTAVYGGNALHGVVNVITARSSESSLAGLELGSYGLARFRLNRFGKSDSGLRLTAVRDGGFRDDSGYRQFKLNAFRSGGGQAWDWTGAVAVSGLDQDTAGYITGLDSYRDRQTARSNPDPEAFRKALNLRAWARLEYRRGEAWSLVLTPYLRHSRMRFRMHFLPGDPYERNGHSGAGLQTAAYIDRPSWRLIAGLDFEYAQGDLQQWQEGDAAGSAFVREVFPSGDHYDYEVDAGWLAPFAQLDLRPGSNWTASFGVRYERARYDYRTMLPAGRTRDDLTPCGFGGCRYSRPANRADSFGKLSPKASIMWSPSGNARAWLSLSHGFRMPQATELYRLQGRQATAELRPEQLRAAELGASLRLEAFAAQAALYHMRKRDVLFRDAELFNRAGGGTRHEGFEIDVSWQAISGLAVELTGSVARHRYDKDYLLGGVNLNGLDVDTAPRRFGGTRLRWQGRPDWQVELEWLWTSGYFMEPENRHRYPGHEILNLRARAALGPRVIAYLRMLNLTGRAYADRADYTVFSGERYFPGPPRSLFAGLEWRWGASDRSQGRP
ncbi:MAG: TonB-dependent receptor [Gammaproteobacteria bacterium]|nr:TonB-dependent receptor [Gammaproteobacteria bacterium]